MNSDAVRAAVLDEMIAESDGRLAALKADILIEERFNASLKQRRGAITIAPVPAPATTISTNGSDHPPHAGRPLFDEPPADHADTVAMPQLIASIIAEAGRSLTIDEIAQRVEARGIHKGDKVKGIRGAIHSALGRRQDLFVRKERGVYGLVSEHSDATETQAAGETPHPPLDPS